MRTRTRKILALALAFVFVMAMWPTTALMAMPIQPPNWTEVPPETLPAPNPYPTPTPIMPGMAIVTFDLAGGTRTGGGELTQTVPIGGAAVAPDVYRAGYLFLSWDAPYTNVQNNITITARWAPAAPAPVTPQMVTVTFNPAGGARTGGGQLTQTVPIGGAATAPTVVRAGYNFVGWDAPYSNVQGNITVTAKWTVVTPPSTPTPITPTFATVTFNLNGGVRVGGGALTQMIPTGGAAVEPYVFRQGYVFVGWDASFTNIQRNITITARWTAEADTGMITVEPPKTTVVTGRFMTGNTFTQGGHMPLIYYADTHVVNFVSVQVDGNTLAANTQYMATSATGGSLATAIHLKASYLNTLGAGSHILRVNFTDGAYAEASFTTRIYANAFLDVSTNDWFYRGVQAMTASNLMPGITANTFDPGGNMTRGMIVTLLYKFTGEPSITGFGNPFPDVAAGQSYTNAVIWAAANGIVTGYDNGLFVPQDLMTRQQFAVVLYRYQNALGSNTATVLPGATYSDMAQVSAYATNAVSKLASEGVFRDWPYDAQNRFQPQANVTRGEVAAAMRLWIESIGW